MTAVESLARLPTTRSSGQPESVRTQAIFGSPPCGIALPLNRKTTENALQSIPLDGLEPRQEFMPVKGLEAYLGRPRQDPPDVAHVIMRDGRERLIVQEGHTRLGAAKLRGEASCKVRLWEFVQTDTGDFEPVLRGYHRIKSGYRKKLISMLDDNDEDIINLPDIADVSIPTLIGNTKRKKRKPVNYKGVKLSRWPMKFEAQVLSLTEIPPRLDLAVTDLQNANRSILTTLGDIAHFGSMQCLLELVRQGAPRSILATPPRCEDAVFELTATLHGERNRAMTLVRDEFIAKLRTRRVSDQRRQALVHELSERRTPGILKRTSKHAVNAAFALGRAAVIAQYRRPRVDLAYHDWETGKFVSKTEAIAQGHITIDAVIQTAVMDTNTCEECEDVDGEVMEYGDERQQELHPPYVKCLGGDFCRCLQIAILGDGTQIDVDEIDEDTIE